MTYARLGVSRETFDEISRLLKAANYQHAFHDGVVDMKGITLVVTGSDASHIVVSQRTAMLCPYPRCPKEVGKPCPKCWHANQGDAA